ncbi:hypothetical protein SDC9_189565 [bioreactor metagenome]|uniref:Uncharacterized protein n=1 Tax=bioreactor metagenome TaxID=1076179 RepID=A0A645HUZ0_9ZZZZ
MGTDDAGVFGACIRTGSAGAGKRFGQHGRPLMPRRIRIPFMAKLAFRTPLIFGKGIPLLLLQRLLLATFH